MNVVADRSLRVPAAPAVGSDVASTREIHLGKLVFLLAQLGMLAIAIRQFQVESSALLRISLLAFGGFAIHYFLPMAARLPFFVCLSLGGIVLVLGPANAAWLLFFGLIIIAICHIRVPLWGRAAMLLALGALLAALRLELVTGPWSRAIWPILGAMFMFRVIVYVYDLQHEKAPASPWRSLAYFFPLPNICFPLFPVIDYKGMRRAYYDVDRHRIYQTGIDWMARGVLHLVLYRVVYYHFTVAPADVIDPDTLVQHIVANFMLYLKISGTFHLITGMLHLFGFNLLETHHHYGLSASFTDFWRRINIYWKDFMMKLFYYPTYFRAKRYGPTVALVVSTFVVFVGTWILHSYQWFWLRGEFPITWQDAFFWMTLAVLVVWNSMREMEHGRSRSLSPHTWNAKLALTQGLRTVGMFFFLCVLWSIWTCESLPSWLGMWEFLWQGVPAEGSRFPTLLLAVAAVVFLAAVVAGRETRGAGAAGRRPGELLAASTMVTVLTVTALAAAGLPAVYTRLGTDTANAILLLRTGQLSRADAAMLEKGYYEDLTRVNRFNSELWQLYMNRPVFTWLDVMNGGGLGRLTGDFLQQELVPLFKADTPYGTMETNRWGMRDRDYEKIPPPDAVRIAMLGASTVMGWGVEADQSFEALLEKGLNASAAPSGPLYEVLNFAVAGYYPLQLVPLLDKALEFRPQVVIYVATGREISRITESLADAAIRGIEIPYPYLREVVANAGVSPGMDRTIALRRLADSKRDVATWQYGHIVSQSRDRGATPIWVFLPDLAKGSWQEETLPSLELARAAGFAIVNLDGVFDEHTVEELRVAEWDVHPNATGHALIARRLLTELTSAESPLRRPDRARSTEATPPTNPTSTTEVTKR
jgi:hypothetical protein